MLAQEVIRRKRDGESLGEEDIAFMVRGISDGSVSESQVAAFGMAVFLNGMTRAECVALTDAMARSGQVLDWRGVDLRGPLLDKHSTGGIGDKVSLVLAPMIAACGVHVPMVSGRGLGHTGGTLDKLEAIPGYGVTPDLERFRRVVRDVGCAIVGQTDEMAPADRRFYAVRDVTATVESIPLITASILSKKRAAGVQALVMDVKTGSGAFARQLADARALATSIVEVANGADLPTTALITDMNQALGTTAGNAVEVHEAIAFLSGGARARRLHDVGLALGAEMLRLGGLAADDATARGMLSAVLDDGRAADRFGAMVAALGGPADIIENADRHLPRAPVVKPVFADEAGYVAAMDTRAIGMAIVELGGGRRLPGDAVDHAVGLTEVRGPGDPVGPDRPIAVLHAGGEDAWNTAAGRMKAATVVTGARPDAAPLIYERYGAD